MKEYVIQLLKQGQVITASGSHDKHVMPSPQVSDLIVKELLNTHWNES